MTKPYHHVLIATDLSKQGEYIVKRGLEIAELMHAKISLVHVLPHMAIPYATEFSVPIDAEFEGKLKDQAQLQLDKFAKKHGIAENNCYLEEGSVKLAVSELAKKIKVDLIVVGAHSREGIEILLGSQANAILHAAPCDVWVVRIKN